MRNTIVVVALVAALVATLLTAPLATRAAEEKKGFDLTDIIMKLPVVVPFIASKVKTEDCKRRLEQFRVDMQDLTPTTNVGVIKNAFCELKRPCTGEIVDTFMGYIKSGGMIEKIAQQQLGPDVDLKTVDQLIWSYYDKFCAVKSESEMLAEKRARGEEL